MINGVTYQCVIVLPIMEYRGEGARDRTQYNDDGMNPEEENKQLLEDGGYDDVLLSSRDEVWFPGVTVLESLELE